jgi:hypothetical protein
VGFEALGIVPAQGGGQAIYGVNNAPAVLAPFQRAHAQRAHALPRGRGQRWLRQKPAPVR